MQAQPPGEVWLAANLIIVVVGNSKDNQSILSKEITWNLCFLEQKTMDIHQFRSKKSEFEDFTFQISGKVTDFLWRLLAGAIPIVFEAGLS